MLEMSSYSSIRSTFLTIANEAMDLQAEIQRSSRFCYAVAYSIINGCRLKGQQEAWQKKLDALPQIKMLIANCILTAAITVYCGPLKTCIRHKFFENLLRVCKSQGFPAAGEDLNNVLKIAAYPEFMLGVVRTIASTLEA